MHRASPAPGRNPSDLLWSIRNRHGLTRKELAKLLHVSGQSFDEWIRGDTMPHDGHRLWLVALDRFPTATKILLSMLKGVDI